LGDASKAQKVLGWTPNMSLESLIAFMVDADMDRVEREELAGKRAVNVGL
jgi:GDPmannose 4,6-dehydratase